MKLVTLFFICCFVLLQTEVRSQQKDSASIRHDSVQLHHQPKDSIPVKDSAVVVKKKHDPHKATVLSAVLPGAGQVYNKKYWKVPIVYAALGITGYLYFYNKSWYQKCQYALAVVTNGSADNPDSLNMVDPKLQGLVLYGDKTDIINYRNEFRRNQDYSALFFLLFWGLNIVDATVDAHLKDFNVNNDLSFRIKPALLQGSPGISVVFDIHKGKPKLIDLRN